MLLNDESGIWQLLSALFAVELEARLAENASGREPTVWRRVTERRVGPNRVVVVVAVVFKVDDSRNNLGVLFFFVIVAEQRLRVDAESENVFID